MLRRMVIIISAIALGIVVMFLPIAIIMPIYQSQEFKVTPIFGMDSNSGSYAESSLVVEIRAAQTMGRSDVESAAFPSNLLNAGAVVFFSLIIAVGTSLLVISKVSLKVLGAHSPPD